MKQIYALFLCLFVLTANATDYYVSNSGSNLNDGLSLTTAFLTIQHASDQTTAGDNVLVADGTYAGFDHRSTSGTSAAPITFKALGNNVLINTSGPIRDDGINIENADYIVVEGFKVINMPGNGNGIRVVLADFCRIRLNTCDGNAERGIFTGFTDDIIIEDNVCSNSVDEHGIYVSNSSDRPIVRYNVCFGNNNIGIHMNGDASIGGDGIINDPIIHNNIIFDNNQGAGINLDGAQSPVIYNNLIYNNHFSQGIALFQQDGAVVTNSAKIYNNTIVVPTDGRWGILVADGANVNTEIYNNIIINQHPWRGCISAESTSQFSSDHNILNDKMSNIGDGNTISLVAWQALGLDGNSLLADPLTSIFLNPGIADYHLAAGSQAIDAGTSLVAPIVQFDQGGAVRPMGAGYDIGAYEYSSTTIATDAKIELIIEEYSPYHTQAPGGSFQPIVTPLIVAGDDLSTAIQSVVVTSGATPYSSSGFNDGQAILFDGEFDFVWNSGVKADFFGVDPALKYIDVTITFNTNVDVQSVILHGFNNNHLYNTTGTTIFFPNSNQNSLRVAGGNPWKTVYAAPTSTNTNTITIRASTTYKLHLTEIEVTGSTAGSISAPQPAITASWNDFLSNSLSSQSLAPFQPNTVNSPSALPIGYYGLVFESDDSTIPLPQRIPGATREFGFAVLSTTDVPATLNPDPVFGMVHMDIDDPYIKPGFSKTMTTRYQTGTILNTTAYLNAINERKSKNYLEMPLVVGSFWDTDDNQAITSQQLQDLQTIMEQYFESDTEILNWELGLEENLSKWSRPFYWSNLQQKVATVQAARDLKNPNAKLIYQIAGTNTTRVETFLQSSSAPLFDVLALHPYRWNEFPMPESWLANYLDVVENLKVANNSTIPIWFTEVGAPHDGNPEGLFIQGGNNITGKNYYDGARFLSKLHVISLFKGVEKVIWYNYHDRGPDPTYPEDHFGIVDHWGFPKAAYPAYQTVVNQLHDKSFTQANLVNWVNYIFEFENPTTGTKTIVAWVYPNGSQTLALSDLASDLNSGNIIQVLRTDGLPIAVSGSSIQLEDYPIFIEYQPSTTGGALVDVSLFLEGALNSGATGMTDTLSQLSLLPITDPYTNTYTLIDPTILNNGYVDWVLVELRDSDNPTVLVADQAALLRKNGEVVSVDESSLDFGVSPGVYHLFVKHRNHLSVMTAQPITLVAGQVTSVDFRSQDSYSGTGSGQVEVSPGLWALFLGDSYEDTNGYDISVLDKSLWNTENGNFLQYLPSDFNLDGDVNAFDNLLLGRNFGVFSGVPK